MDYCLLVLENFKHQDLVNVFGSCTGIDEFTVKAGDYSVASNKFILVTCVVKQFK